MTQTQPPPSQKPEKSTSSQDDPLSHLHKMSVTAGLGSGDYVAVNGGAVAALLLGLASALVLLEPFLLVIPLACAVVSFIAWRQIRNSNRTQTGKSLIAIGLLCALGFGGFVLVRQATEEMRTREDRMAIAGVVAQIGEKTRAGDYASLYELFSERFRSAVPRETFDERMSSIRESELYGKLTTTTWNNLVDFETDSTTGIRYATARIAFSVERAGQPIPVTLSMSRGDAGWKIEGMPEIFPPEPPAQQ